MRKKAVVSSICAASLAALAGHATALPGPGDDFTEQCTQQNVSVDYYQGTAYCTATQNGNNYPLSYYVTKQTEPTIVLKGGNLSCRAQVPYFTSETTVKTVCNKVPLQPYYSFTLDDWGCLNQKATGRVVLPTYQNKRYILERSVDGSPFMEAGINYSIPGKGLHFTYRLQTQDLATGAYGSWYYVDGYANCQGRGDT